MSVCECVCVEREREMESNHVRGFDIERVSESVCDIVRQKKCVFVTKTKYMPVFCIPDKVIFTFYNICTLCVYFIISRSKPI